VRFRALLWAVRQARTLPPLPGARALGRAIEVDPLLPASFYAAIGRRVLGGLAVRADRLERLVASVRERARTGRFPVDAALASLAGLGLADLKHVLPALGYRVVVEGGVELYRARNRRAQMPQFPAGRRPAPGDGHPFAKLKELKFA
jgi:hypothetical protein